jgi:hypothetical protein
VKPRQSSDPESWYTRPTNVATRTLERIEREFERIGLLMRHDAELPSFTALATGAPIAGSWWADPRCHEIYDLLQEFAAGAGTLSAKIINGKITYVHARLWPALLTIAQNPAPERLRNLSRPGRLLRERVHSQTSVRADELRKSGFATTAEIGKAIRELELKLLVHTDAIHTESGAHAKVLTTWAAWASERDVATAKMSFPAATTELGRAVAALCAHSRRKPKLPW